MLNVEVDGWEVHSSDEARRSDFERQNRLSALGWAFLRYDWHDVVRRPAKTGAEIRAVYLARLAGLGRETDA
jgi:very-short-patch-repair endonuclease